MAQNLFPSLAVGPFSRTGQFLSSDPEWVSDTIDWLSDEWGGFSQGYYSINVLAAGSISINSRLESSNDPSFPVGQVDVKNSITQEDGIRRFPFGYYGLRYQRLVLSSPVTDLTDVIIESAVSGFISRSTPRLINDTLSEDSHSDFTAISVASGLTGEGKAKAARITPLQRLEVQTNQKVTQSGSTFVEGIRDDISLSFSAGKGAESLTKLNQVFISGSGSFSHDATAGQLSVKTGPEPGAVTYIESIDTPIYEPGHAIRGEQTIVVFSGLSNLVSGDGKSEVGFAKAKTDGSGEIEYGIGTGIDANGGYTWRINNGVYESKVYQADYNRDKLGGGKYSRYIRDGVPIAPTGAGIEIVSQEFEWLGIAPPSFSIMSPAGEQIVFNVEETPGSQNTPTVPDPEMPLMIRVQTDSTVGGKIEIRSGSWRGSVYTGKTVIQAEDSVSGVYQDIKARSPNDNNANPGFALETLGYNLTFDPNGTPSNRWDRLRGVGGKSKSVTQPLPFDFSDPVRETATTSSEQILAATSGRLERAVTITVPSVVGLFPQEYGICLKFGNGNASATSGVIYPGQTVSFMSNQRIAVIRDSRATSDVEFSYFTGVPAE